MLATVKFFLFKIRVAENGIKRSKYLAFNNMLLSHADFFLPLRFINSAILFVFLEGFWMVVLLLIVSIKTGNKLKVQQLPGIHNN